MRRFGFYQYSCLVWCINVVLIILSYFTNTVFGTEFILLLAAFIPYCAMILLDKKEKFGLDRIYKYSTTRSKLIVLMSIIYILVSSSISLFLLRNGRPHIYNGVYCLWNLGFVREITKEEYEALLPIEGRTYIGFCLVFSALPVVYFSARKNILDSHRQ